MKAVYTQLLSSIVGKEKKYHTQDDITVLTQNWPVTTFHTSISNSQKINQKKTNSTVNDLKFHIHVHVQYSKVHNMC